jgi:hypothetical protein
LNEDEVLVDVRPADDVGKKPERGEELAAA